MTKRNLIGLVILLTGLSISLFFLLSIESQSDNKWAFTEKKSTHAMPPEAIEQLLNMTMDPRLERRTPETLLKVREQLKRGKFRVEKDFEIDSWEERGPTNVAGRTRAILIDKQDSTGNTVWAGSVSGGLWKSANFLSDTTSWSPVNDFFQNIAVSTIVQDPNNPLEIYFGTGEGWFNSDAVRGLGIWKTSDGGENWDRLPSTNVADFTYVQKIIITDESHIYACTRWEGLQKSTDGGNTWVKVLGGGIGGAFSDRAADIEVSANGDLYVSFGIFSSDGIYKSSDGGQTWIDLISNAPENGLPESGFHRIELAIAPSDSHVVYALFADDEDGSCMGIFRTSDGGNSWVSLPVPGTSTEENFTRDQAWYDLIAKVDPINDSIIYIGGIDLLRSKDAGQSWQAISHWYGDIGLPEVHADQHSIDFFPYNNSKALVGNDGGIYMLNLSEDSLNTSIHFYGKNRGYNVTQFYSCDIHPMAGSNMILGGTQDNGTQFFSIPGLNVTTEVTGGDGGFCFIDQDEPNIQISTFVYNNIRITKNTWNDFERFSIGERTGSFINPMDYDDRLNTLITSHEKGYIGRIREVGTNNVVDSIHVSAFDSMQITGITADPNVSNRFWLAGSKMRGDDSNYLTKIVSMDNADMDVPIFSENIIEISDQEYNGYAYARHLEISQGNPDKMIMLFSNPGIPNIWLTKDKGANWINVDGNLPQFPIFWVLFDPSTSEGAIVATEMGIWATQKLDGANTVWAVMNQGLANVRVDMLKFRPSDKTLVAATHGRGIFTTILEFSCDSSLTVSVDQVAANQASVQVSGGTAPYTYLWSDSVQQDADIAIELALGLYQVTVLDDNGCTGFGEVEIAPISQILPDVIGSAGASFISNELHLDWTIGEVLIDQKQEGVFQLSEGFHQNDLNQKAPDFEVVEISVSSDLIFSGEFNLNGGTMIIKNNGTLKTPNETAAIVISDDDILDFEDPLVGFASFGMLEPGQTDTSMFSIDIPQGTPTGQYFLLSCLDEFNFTIESSEDNNCAEGTIEISDDSARPDLVISNIDLRATEFFAGDRVFPARATVQNIGSSPVTSFLFHNIYFSTDDTAQPEELVRSIFTFDDIPAGDSFDIEFFLIFDNSLFPGQYYLIGEADAQGRLEEANEENNLFALEITIRDTLLAPDITVTSSMITNSPAIGAPLESSSVLSNIGDYKIGETRFGVYLTKSDTVDNTRIRIGTTEIASLEPSQLVTVNTSFEIPDTLQPGLWNIIYSADAFFWRYESNENNNDLFLREIEIQDSNPGSATSRSSEIVVYPNPTSDILHIRAAGYEHLNYEIVQSNGTRVQTGSFAYSKMIETTEMTPGVYFLLVADKSGFVRMFRFVKM